MGFAPANFHLVCSSKEQIISTMICFEIGKTDLLLRRHVLGVNYAARTFVMVACYCEVSAFCKIKGQRLEVPSFLRRPSGKNSHFYIMKPGLMSCDGT
jgi:hypothetical protein